MACFHRFDMACFHRFDMACFHRFDIVCFHRFDMAALRTLLSIRHFEAEIQFVPVEDPDEVLTRKEKCYNR